MAVIAGLEIDRQRQQGSGTQRINYVHNSYWTSGLAQKWQIAFEVPCVTVALVSRVYALILSLEMCVAAYRAALTNQHYMRPWETVHAETDPRGLYSLAGGVFLAAFMVMCDLWLLVTELERELSEQARTDSLTGAMNRRVMEEAALRETARRFAMVVLCKLWVGQYSASPAGFI